MGGSICRRVVESLYIKMRGKACTEKMDEICKEMHTFSVEQGEFFHH
jgi:hypothetical protein